MIFWIFNSIFRIQTYIQIYFYLNFLYFSNILPKQDWKDTFSPRPREGDKKGLRGVSRESWDTLGYPGILWDTRGYPGILWDTREYFGMPGDTLGYFGIPWDTLGYPGILWDTRGYFGIPEYTLGYLSILWDTRGYQEYPGIPGNTQGFPYPRWIPSDTQ